MAGSVIQGEHGYMKQTPKIAKPCCTYPVASSITNFRGDLGKTRAMLRLCVRKSASGRARDRDAER
jgi:hypothetical protein